MTHAEKQIVEIYSGLLDSLNPISKLELLENLAKSIRKNSQPKERDFYSSFGAFASEKSADELIIEIRESRKFRQKDLKL